MPAYEAVSGRHMRRWCRSTLRASVPHLPLGRWPFFVCTPGRTAQKLTTGPLPHPFRSPLYHRDRLKPPQGISWRSLGHPRQPFLLMCRKSIFLPLVSNIVSVCWERGPHVSHLYCKTGNDSVRPPHTFRSRRGRISAVWRGNRCGCSPTYWPRQDARRSPDGWPDNLACLQCGSGRTQTSLERTPEFGQPAV